MRLMERAILQIFHSVRHFSPETAWHAPVQTARLYLAPFFYKSSDPKRLKYIPARRHILPFSTGKYVCREDTDDFAAQVCALLQQEDYGSLAALSYNGRDIPVTAEDTEEYFHDDLVYFRKNVGDLSLLEELPYITTPLGNRSHHPLLLQGRHRRHTLTICRSQ